MSRGSLKIFYVEVNLLRVQSVALPESVHPHIPILTSRPTIVLHHIGEVLEGDWEGVLVTLRHLKRYRLRIVRVLVERRDVTVGQKRVNLSARSVVVTEREPHTLWVPIPMAIDGGVLVLVAVILGDEATGSHLT